MEKTTEMIKPYSKIAELLGKPQPDAKDIYVDDKGDIVSREGTLDVKRFVKKALSL